MKKLLITAFLTTFSFIISFGAPPKLMLLPDKQWCNDNGYVDRQELNGRTRVTERYDDAFLNGTLKNVEAEFKSLMSADGRSFPIISYTEAMSANDDEDALDEMFEGAESGAGVGSSAFEDLMAAKGNAPDIFIKIGWNVEKAGMRKSIIYRVDAVDAYSSKSVATITGMTEPVLSSTSDAICLMTGLRDKMDEFETKLLNHFDDIQKNGREISLRLRIIDNGSGLKFTDEYDGKELAAIITDWVAENTLNHQFTENQSTRNIMSFDQVRVPIFDERNRPQQAKQWVSKLQSYLKNNYRIVSENNSSGLGTGRLYIGEK